MQKLPFICLFHDQSLVYYDFHYYKKMSGSFPFTATVFNMPETKAFDLTANRQRHSACSLTFFANKLCLLASEKHQREAGKDQQQAGTYLRQSGKDQRQAGRHQRQSEKDQQETGTNQHQAGNNQRHTGTNQRENNQVQIHIKTT